MTERTPQEKKRLSYEKDRRNSYGESPHAARKAIPKRKTDRNRANRHNEDQPLRMLSGTADEEQAEFAESRLHHKAPKNWNKYPDKKLAETVRKKLERRRRIETAGGRRHSTKG